MTLDDLVLQYRIETRDALRQQERFESRIRRGARNMKRDVVGLRDGFRGVHAAVLALGVGAAVGALDRFLERGAQIGAITQGARAYADRIGETSDAILRELRPATQGLVDDMELLRQSNAIVQLGIAGSAQEMGEMADISVRLGRAVGLNATQAIESMTVGLGRQSRLMLDNLGIIVDANTAYEKYAERVGKSASSLTDLEKKQAFINEAMEQGRLKAEGLEPPIGRLSEKWQQLKVDVTNATDALIDFFDRGGRAASSGDPLVDQLNRLRGGQAARLASSPTGSNPFLNAIGLGVDAQRERGLRGAAENFSAQDDILSQMFARDGGLEPAVEEMRELSVIVPSVALGLDQLGLEWEDHTRGVQASVDAAGAYLEGIQPLLDETIGHGIGEFNASLGQQPDLFEGVTAGALEASEAYGDFIGRTAEMTEAIDFSAERFGFLEDALNAASQAMIHGALTGELSARVIVRSVAQQVAGQMGAIAIRESVLGLAALAAAANPYNAPLAAQFKESASKHFAAAGMAAGFAAGGIALGALAGGGGGSQRAGVVASGSDTSDTPTSEGTTSGPVQVTVALTGQGFVQDREGFAREIAAEIAAQLSRGGQ